MDNRKTSVSGSKTQKRIIRAIILIALGLQITVCFRFVWVNMGLSRAVNEKTLNISYDELINNYEFQLITRDTKPNFSYTGGPFFDQYVDYNVDVDSSEDRLSLIVFVDKSTQEVEYILLDYFIIEDVYDPSNRIAAKYTDIYLFIREILDNIDENMPKEVIEDICECLRPFENKKLKASDSYTYNGITYNMSAGAGNRGYYKIEIAAPHAITLLR